MRLTKNEYGELCFVLSERNLLVLLSKLYTPQSARQIVCGDVPEGYQPVKVMAEPDGDHYTSVTRKEAPAGRMHPVTEKILDRIKEVIREEELSVETSPPIETPQQQLQRIMGYTIDSSN